MMVNLKTQLAFYKEHSMETKMIFDDDNKKIIIEFSGFEVPYEDIKPVFKKGIVPIENLMVTTLFHPKYAHEITPVPQLSEEEIKKMKEESKNYQEKILSKIPKETIVEITQRAGFIYPGADSAFFAQRPEDIPGHGKNMAPTPVVKKEIVRETKVKHATAQPENKLPYNPCPRCGAELVIKGKCCGSKSVKVYCPSCKAHKTIPIPNNS